MMLFVKFIEITFLCCSVVLLLINVNECISCYLKLLQLQTTESQLQQGKFNEKNTGLAFWTARIRKPWEAECWGPGAWGHKSSPLFVSFQPTPVFLPGESQGWGSLVGCRLWVAQSQTWLKWLSSNRLLHIMGATNLQMWGSIMQLSAREDKVFSAEKSKGKPLTWIRSCVHPRPTMMKQKGCSGPFWVDFLLL